MWSVLIAINTIFMVLAIIFEVSVEVDCIHILQDNGYSWDAVSQQTSWWETIWQWLTLIIMTAIPIYNIILCVTYISPTYQNLMTNMLIEISDQGGNDNGLDTDSQGK